ncbi:MAG: tetratricopeptide repeat protein, partial [Candidatus Heimdallarchaeota archaeon]|nr:tetratricopeptide repeat protein [Candidatus Heimdallarchaeota archaeon]MCK4253839.1 tetratricopeptide repeat protein [Candidatus Heimdallarchaeota archaeon]
DRILQAQINNTIGIIELERGNFQIAHQIFLKSEAIAKEIKMDRLLGHVARSIGEIYLQMGHLDEALFWYNKSYSTVKEWKNDNRSLYVIHASFADIYFAKEEFEKAKIEMEKVLQILENGHFKDLFMQMKYAEILLYLADVSLVESILSQIEKEWKSKLSPTQKTFFLFLLGFLEYKKSNYGNAQDFLQKAMLLSDELGNEILSSKTLVLLSVVFLKKYTLTLDLEELIEADKCLEDIITYLEEKAKYESLSLIYYIRSKIKIIVLDFETALFLLKRGEELARTYTPLLVENYEEKISLVKKAIESDVDTIIDTGLVEFIEDIDSITTILRKESKKLAAPKGEKPIAVLLFHSSGIPIRTYLSEEVRVTDDLLFGGFVSAIRHLMNELFLDQKQKVLSIDHGQYKLLIEFYSNVFSVVVIALRDSYMLRRKMHRLVEHLSVKGLFKDKFKGDLAETSAFELDSLVRNLFGIRSQN